MRIDTSRKLRASPHELVIGITCKSVVDSDLFTIALDDVFEPFKDRTLDPIVRKAFEPDAGRAAIVQRQGVCGDQYWIAAA